MTLNELSKCKNLIVKEKKNKDHFYNIPLRRVLSKGKNKKSVKLLTLQSLI